MPSNNAKYFQKTRGQTAKFIIKPGSPWENGFCESFNFRIREELLNGELFDNLYEAEVLTKRWAKYYNTIRPHSSLGSRPPVPKTIIPRQAVTAN